MKILFSADWHIKLGQRNVPKDWQKNRFRMLYEELYKIEAQVDMHVIGGDIFDSIPSLEELQLFSEYVTQVTVPTIIYSGNHEATKKGHTFFEYLQPIFEQLNSNVEVALGVGEIEGIDVIPYENLKTFKPEDFSGRFLFTHVRGAIEPHVKPEIDLDKLNRWDRVFAGDLHSHSNTQRNIVYPGSPLTTTFHRSKATTGVIILDSETGDYDWIELKLPQLIRKTVESEEEMLPTKFDHTIYELVGELEDLAKVNKSNSLLDKKISHRKVEATLDFSKVSSIADELVLYLKDIKQVSDTDRYMREFNDTI